MSVSWHMKLSYWTLYRPAYALTVVSGSVRQAAILNAKLCWIVNHDDKISYSLLQGSDNCSARILCSKWHSRKQPVSEDALRRGVSPLSVNNPCNYRKTDHAFVLICFVASWMSFTSAPPRPLLDTQTASPVCSVCSLLWRRCVNRRSTLLRNAYKDIITKLECGYRWMRRMGTRIHEHFWIKIEAVILSLKGFIFLSI